MPENLWLHSEFSQEGMPNKSLVKTQCFWHFCLLILSLYNITNILLRAWRNYRHKTGYRMRCSIRKLFLIKTCMCERERECEGENRVTIKMRGWIKACKYIILLFLDTDRKPIIETGWLVTMELKKLSQELCWGKRIT